MISFLGLVCGVLASLAVGVLMAHVLCVTMFRFFSMHARQSAERTATRLALKTAGQL